MSRIVITIDTGNAAFEDEPGFEVCRILHELADRLKYGLTHRVVLRDINGNRVGQLATED